MKLIGELVFTGVRKKEGHEPGGRGGSHNQREGGREGGLKWEWTGRQTKKYRWCINPEREKGFEKVIFHFLVKVLAYGM